MRETFESLSKPRVLYGLMNGTLESVIKTLSFLFSGKSGLVTATYLQRALLSRCSYTLQNCTNSVIAALSSTPRKRSGLKGLRHEDCDGWISNNEVKNLLHTYV
jgi:hypothetical protein